MAPTFTNLTKGQDTSNLTAYTTASITVTSGKPVLLAVCNSHGTGSPATPTLTVPSGVTVQNSGNPIENQQWNSDSRRLTVFWLTGSGTGTIGISIAQTAGVNPNGCLWWADEVNDASTATPAAADSDKASGTGTTATVDLSSVASGNSVWAAVASAGSSAAISAGTNYTEVSDEVVMTLPDVKLGAVYRANHDDATPEATLSASTPWAMVAVEVTAGVQTVTPATVAGTATVPMVSISAGGGQNVPVAAVAAVASVGTATLVTGSSIAATTVAAVASFDLFGAETSVTVDVSTVASTATVETVVASVNVAIAVSTVAATATVPGGTVTITYTFFPPVVFDVPSVAHSSEVTQTRLNHRLFRHYGVRGPRGRTVIKTNGTYTTLDYPTQDQLDAADVVYLGGHIYSVSATEAADLVAAGYASNVS